MDVGIIGMGTLGRAIAAGLERHEAIGALRGTNRSSGDNGAVAAASDVILLCVKPFQVEDVAREIADALTEDKLVITCAASVALRSVEAWSVERAPVVRAMPNMPCRIGAGMTVLAAGARARPEHLLLAQSIFETLGRVAIIDERLMDAATGISGCGPAYAYVIIESLSDAGVKLGLPRHVARLLAAQTMMGSAKMALESDAHPAALKDEVTTPAGCTIDGLMELEDGKLRHTLLRAAVAAANRSSALGTLG
jgi:pyrroline-5-carboxylate reductase